MDETIPELERPQMSDYYLALGLQQTATFQDIKRAHHLLAKKHHPDKQAPGKITDAHDFRRVSTKNSKQQREAKAPGQIREAYECLRDASKRSEYDAYYPQLRGEWVQYRIWQETQRRNKELRREAERARRMAEEQRAAREQAEQDAKAAEERASRRRAEEERLARDRELRERMAEYRSREVARKAREEQEHAAIERLHKQKEMEAERKSEESAKRARQEREMAAKERLKSILIEEKQDAIRQNWASIREAAERRQAKPGQPATQHPTRDCIHPQLGWPKKKGEASCIFCGETPTKFTFHCPECNAAACALCKSHERDREIHTPVRPLGEAHVGNYLS
ncbi:hypothetical protein P152DRAFT_453335 [Eremomyces bilateralis CBS 781.70]|uniref:J domain-containing protein n=1 Tax=Eremomyces bilateralis CBS 781.70 TaxID=1392243 RepID=A0A6G1FQ99_9PEZI|nr:uncharacterized protein P152DRAFT_453335 [Eremomyces bilateralis CBS 781.70]KAF1807880.1 hypothetical protein P152DRAFT_453335 [Eremomyces bilateralis CBS 781.70]